MTSFPWQFGDSTVSPGRALPNVIGPSTLELAGGEEGSARLHRSLCSTEVLAANR